MFITATELLVAIDHPQNYYTHNDIVKGQIILSNKKPRSFLTLKAELTCTETASVTVSTSNGTYEEVESHHWLEIEQCLFPTPTMQAMPSAPLKKSGYTLQTGKHHFPFEFRLPSASRADLPPTCRVDHKSGILWAINARLEAPPILVDRTMTASAAFEFQSSAAFPLAPKDSPSKKVAKEIKVYLPGFAEWQQPLSAKLLNLVPQFAKFRTKTTIELTETVLCDPINQGPHVPVGIDLDISLSDPKLNQLLCITGLECRLKRKIALVAGRTRIPRREFHHYESVLFSQHGIQWSLKEGIEKARDAVSKVCIVERLPPSRNEALVNVFYKLVLIITVASEEAPTRSDKLRVSIPVHLQPFHVDESRPPEYAVHHMSAKFSENEDQISESRTHELEKSRV